MTDMNDLRLATADLIRKLMDQALRETAPYHWREAEGGEQLVRVRDLLTWAEQAATRIENQAKAPERLNEPA